MEFDKKIWPKRHELTKEYFTALREYEENRETENNSALCVQNYFRSHKVRVQLRNLNAKALIIQRVFRGFLGRRTALLKGCERDLKNQQDEYNAFATKIQKVWRGHRSRGKKMDYYARKRYINELYEKSTELMDKLNADRQQKEEEHERKLAEKRDREFQTLSQNLNHLRSTESIKGIYGDQDPRLTRTAFGKTMDEQLKMASKKYHSKLRRKFEE